MERLVFWLWARVVSRSVYELSGRLARRLQTVVTRGDRIGRVRGLFAAIAPPLGSWTAARDARPIAPQSFREQWRDDLGRRAENRRP